MADSERFSEPLERALIVLRNAIQKRDVPLAQKDKLAVLVLQLREFPYQAGRAEALRGRQGGTVHGCNCPLIGVIMLSTLITTQKGIRLTPECSTKYFHPCLVNAHMLTDGNKGFMRNLLPVAYQRLSKYQRVAARPRFFLSSSLL